MLEPCSLSTHIYIYIYFIFIFNLQLKIDIVLTKINIDWILENKIRKSSSIKTDLDPT